MIIYGTYKIDEILPEFAVNSKFKKKKKLGEFKIKANSERLVLFNKQYQENKKIFCVACNLEANYFNLETSIGNDTPHLNLYSSDGILFTKDHIIAKSNGGTNNLNNYQVMCTKCNIEKGNK